MAKILIIEDDVELRSTLTEMLERKDYEVVSASDGEEGLQKAYEINPDLILLDIKMPLGGGIKAFETIRNNPNTENIPVIFITAFPSVEIKKQVIDMGAEGFIAKPFGSEELLEKISSIIWY